MSHLTTLESAYLENAVGWQHGRKEGRQLCSQRNSAQAMGNGCEEKEGLPEKVTPAKDPKMKGTQMFHYIEMAKDAMLEADAWQFVKA